MSKLFRRLVAVTLAIVMCFCIGTTVFAADTTDSENTSNINWWEIGWIILSDYVEKLIDLDGQSVKDSDWAYLVSPSVEYNTGDMGPEVYFRPQVDNTVGTIRMHGHRIIFVDVYAQLALILSDASDETVSQATTGTNQYMFYTKASGDTSRKWKAQFVSTETYKVSAKYSCGFPDPQVLPIIVVDRYLDYFTTIMEDRLWQVLAEPVSRWRNRSGLSMNAARAA